MTRTYEQAKETFERLAAAARRRRDLEAQDARAFLAKSGLALTDEEVAAEEAAYAVVARADERFDRFVRLARRVIMIAPGHCPDDSALYAGRA